MLKIKLIYFSLMLVVLSGVDLLYASDTGNKLKFTSGLDYFLVMNADDKYKDDLSNSIANGSVRSGSIDSKPGYGARIGIRYLLSKVRDTEVGFSVGYAQGPKITDDYSYNLIGIFGKQREVKVHYYRVLAEASRIFHLSQKFGFKITGGIGASNGKMMVKQIGGDAVVPGNPKEYNYSHSTTGFTWEITPSFLYDMNIFTLEIGARYSRFPIINEGNTLTEIKWSSIGFLLGLNF